MSNQIASPANQSILPFDSLSIGEERGKLLKICPICKNRFKSRRKSHKYCSQKCGAYSENRKRGRQIIEYKCAYCKKEFTRDKKNIKYCSRSCADLGRKKRIQKICPVCRKVFEACDYDYQIRVHCSRKCQDIGRKLGDKCKGKNHYLYGKSLPERTKKKLSESLKKYFKNNPKSLKKLTDRMAKQSRKSWADPGYRKKYREIREIRPNKPERTFNEMTPGIVRYVGDAS